MLALETRGGSAESGSERGVQPAQIKVFTDPPSGIKMLQQGRVDVFALRKLGAMTACCMDLPLLIVFSANMDWSWRNQGGYRDPFMALVIVVTGVHVVCHPWRDVGQVARR